METQQCASLTLRTTDATTNTLRTQFTWSNINLRALLGDNIYDKYDNFNLVLEHVVSDVCASNLGTTLNDLILYANIQGLPFLNQGYMAGHQTSSSVLCPLIFPREDSILYTNMKTPLTFNKNQSLVNFVISYGKVNGTAISSQTSPTPPAEPVQIPYPEMVWIFKIYGVPK